MAPAAPATPAVAAGSEGRGLLAMVVVVLEGAAEDRLPPEAAVVAVVEFVDDLGADESRYKGKHKQMLYN